MMCAGRAVRRVASTPPPTKGVQGGARRLYNESSDAARTIISCALGDGAPGLRGSDKIFRTGACLAGSRLWALSPWKRGICVTGEGLPGMFRKKGLSRRCTCLHGRFLAIMWPGCTSGRGPGSGPRTLRADAFATEAGPLAGGVVRNPRHTQKGWRHCPIVWSAPRAIAQSGVLGENTRPLPGSGSAVTRPCQKGAGSRRESPWPPSGNRGMRQGDFL